MKLALIVLCTWCSLLLAGAKHRISAIFTDGEAIQLDDGSACGIGYWMIQNVTDCPIVNTRWREGDAIEFYTEWKGALKVWFYLTNLRTDETVNGWLMHGPFPKNTLTVKEYNSITSVVRLSNSAVYGLNQNWYQLSPYLLPQVITDKVFLIKRHDEESYYLIKAGSYAAEGVEVKLIKPLQP